MAIYMPVIKREFGILIKECLFLCVPLHVQSDYSLLESCNRIEEAVSIYATDMGIRLSL